MEGLRKYKFHFILFSLLTLVLSPLISELTSISHSKVVLGSFSLIVIAGFLTADQLITKRLTILMGSITLIAVWCDYFSIFSVMLDSVRMGSSFLLFCLLVFILVRNFMEAPEIHLEVILGAMAGFVLLGLIGGVSFEIMEYANAGSIMLSANPSSYDYYYYSFISLITVGYGDVVPLSGAAKSLSIVISLVGQFYMTIGIAMFVGKYLNYSNTK